MFKFNPKYGPVTVSLLFLLAALGCGGATNSALEERLPAETGVVVSLDVNRLVNSDLYRWFKDEQPSEAAEMEETTSRFGIDLEKDIQRIVMAGKVDTGFEDYGVVLVQGSWDPEKIVSASEAQPAEEHQGINLYTPKDRSTDRFGFLAEDLALYGSDDFVKKVLDVQAGKAPGLEKGPLFAKLGKVDQTRPVWMVADMTQVADEMADDMMLSTLSQVQNLYLSADLADGIALDVEGVTSSEQEAQSAHQGLQGLLSLVKIGMAQQPEMAGISEGITTETEGSSVYLKVNIPEYLIRKAVEAAKEPDEQPTIE